MENWLIGQVIAFIVIMLFGVAMKLWGQRYGLKVALWPLVLGFSVAFVMQLLIRPWENH